MTHKSRFTQLYCSRDIKNTLCFCYVCVERAFGTETGEEAQDVELEEELDSGVVWVGFIDGVPAMVVATC